MSATIRFEVLVNGERRCVAGVDGLGILAATLTWILRPQDAPPGEVRFEVSGQSIERDEYYGWDNRELSPGDEVTIRVLEAGPFDEPVEFKSPR